MVNEVGYHQNHHLRCGRHHSHDLSPTILQQVTNNQWESAHEIKLRGRAAFCWLGNWHDGSHCWCVWHPCLSGRIKVREIEDLNFPKHNRDALQMVCLGPWSWLKLPKVTFVLGMFSKEGELFTFLVCCFRTVNTWDYAHYLASWALSQKWARMFQNENLFTVLSALIKTDMKVMEISWHTLRLYLDLPRKQGTRPRCLSHTKS